MQPIVLRFIRFMRGFTRVIAIVFSMTLMMTAPTRADVVHVNHASTAGSSATGESWELAYEFLSDGLTDTEDGDEVWVPQAPIGRISRWPTRQGRETERPPSS